MFEAITVQVLLSLLSTPTSYIHTYIANTTYTPIHIHTHIHTVDPSATEQIASSPPHPARQTNLIHTCIHIYIAHTTYHSTTHTYTHTHAYIQWIHQP